MPGHYDETEQIFLFGKLLSGESVSIKLVAFPGDLELLLLDDVCAESAHVSGYYYWDTTKIDWAGMIAGSGSPSPFSPSGWEPAFPLNVLYVMTDSKGNQFSGKFLIGSYPEQVRRTYRNVQTLL